MAELLVKARNVNPRKSIGDVITVKPDGWKWGKDECLPQFVVVKVPDLSEKEAREKYMLPLWDDEIPKEVQTPLKFREKNIEVAEIEIAIKDQKSVITLTKIQLESKIEVKTSGSISL